MAKQTTKRYTFIDLFAGCGGLSEGFLSTKRYEALAHIEWEKPMVDTLRNRLVQEWGHTIEEAQKRVIQFDIQKTEELVRGNWSEESIRDFGQFNQPSVIKNGLDGIINGRTVDLIIGGPPCQAYSIHGRATDKNSMQEDGKTAPACPPKPKANDPQSRNIVDPLSRYKSDPCQAIPGRFFL